MTGALWQKVRVLGACLFLATLAFLPLTASADDLQDRIAEERAYTVEILGHLKKIYGLPCLSFCLKDFPPGTVYIPPGYDAFVKANAAAVDAALLALAADKPMTLEAIMKYRQNYFDTGSADTYYTGLVLFHIATANSHLAQGLAVPSGIVQIFSHRGDENLRRKSEERVVNVAEAKHWVDGLIKTRIPEMKVHFKLGSVTLESRTAREELAAIEQKVSDQDTVVSALERAATRQRADLATALAEAAPKIAAERDKLRLRIIALGDDKAQLANEERYARIAISSLSSTADIRRDAYNKTLVERAREAGKLAELQAEAALSRAKAFPPFRSIVTNDARLSATDRLSDELADIDRQIADVLALMAGLETTREKQIEVLKSAAETADAANWDLALATGGSYLVQATTQAVVQLVDAAVASKGNPHAFAALALTQSLFNATISKPQFYDAQIRNGKAKIIDPSSLSLQAATSLATTTFKTGLGKYVDKAAKSGVSQSTKLLEERAALVALRRVAGKSLQTAAKIVPDSLLFGFVQGLVLDFGTEDVKKKIAAEMQEEELVAYASAQLQLAAAVGNLQEIGKLEDADQLLLETFRAQRADLIEGFEQIPADRALRQPQILFERNAGFEIGADYRVTVSFDGVAPNYDLLFNGTALVPSDKPGIFTVGPNLIAALAKGSPERLNIRLVMK